MTYDYLQSFGKKPKYKEGLPRHLPCVAKNDGQEKLKFSNITIKYPQPISV